MATKAPELPVISRYLGVNSRDRVQVFIDANNLLGMLRSIDMKLDYKRLMAFFKTEMRLVRANYFVLMREDMEEKSQGVIDMIEYTGFNVYRKWGKEIQDPVGGHYRFRGSVIPEMTIAMIDAAENGTDHIIVVSGDSELTAAMDACKERGARVTILANGDTTANELRRGCDAFVEFQSLPSEVFFTP